jgi:hypothetical protein
MATMVPLTEEEIDVLTSSVVERGAYKTFFSEFLSNEEISGVNATGSFPGKKPGTLYQGMILARNDLNAKDSVRVIRHEEQVYLIKAS